MIEMFRLNGEIYCKLYAWTPVRSSDLDNPQWIWFKPYYLRMARYGRAAIVMTEDQFQSHANRRS
jgi:hypothetical protein